MSVSPVTACPPRPVPSGPYVWPTMAAPPPAETVTRNASASVAREPARGRLKPVIAHLRNRFREMARPGAGPLLTAWYPPEYANPTGACVELRSGARCELGRTTPSRARARAGHHEFESCAVTTQARRICRALPPI